MRDWRLTCALIGLEVPAWKAHVFDYLESRGFRFCVEFGIDNAVDVARADWESRKAKR